MFPQRYNTEALTENTGAETENNFHGTMKGTKYSMKTIIKKISQYYQRLDKWLLIAVTFCAGISSVLLYSLSNIEAAGIGPKLYATQVISTVFGILICLILTNIDYHNLVKLWFIFAPVALVLTMLTFTPLGIQRSGADDRAWLNLGFTTIQPSEILKLAFILTFAYHIAKVQDKLNHPLNVLLLCIHGAVPLGLVAIQGDYGTVIVFLMMFLVMLFSAGISIKYIIAALIAAIPGVYILWNYVLQSVHKKRILVLLHPGTDPMGLEYQQDLGLMSLGSGKLFGKGLSGKDYVDVPEIYNDFIFSYIGHVFGFIGAVAVVVILAYICLKILIDSRSAKDPLGKTICMGVFALLFTHCFMNIGMVLKVMPVIGIPLPFFSAGGTALLSMYVAIGFVMSCYCHNDKKYRMFYDYE